VTDDDTTARQPAEQDGFVSYSPALYDDAQRTARPQGLAAAHVVLRGRYRAAIGLSAVLATAGVIAGLTLPRVVYRSVGLIDVAPKVQRIVYDTEEKGLLPMYDAFVESQATLAASRRVTSAVMESREWKDLGRGTSDAEIAKFERSLEVTRMPKNQFIAVAFSDEDPEVAVVAVNKVIDTYLKIVEERETESGGYRIKQLEAQRDVANNQLAELRASVAAITEDLGEEAFEMRYQFAVAELNKLDAKLQELDLQITNEKSATAAGVEPRPLTDQEIAVNDTPMARLLDDAAQIEERIQQLEKDGLGPKNHEVVTAKEALEVVKRRIGDRGAKCRAELAKRPRAVEALEAHRISVAAMRDKAQEECKRLGKQHNALAKIEAEKLVLGERLEDIKRQLATIHVESGVEGRIRLASKGERPVMPESDKRSSIAVFGALGGIGLGFGLVLLYGLTKTRLRHVSDVARESTWGSFLGVLPDVPDPEIDAAAHDAATDLSDHCMQHIRSMLQLRPSDSTRIVAITSASPGAGKTTIGFALGLSFAAAGSRTLLVDADFCGHGMTTAMKSIIVGGAAEAEPESDVAEGQPGGSVAAMLAARRSKSDDDKSDAAEDGPADASPPSTSEAAPIAALARRRFSEGRKMRSGAGILDALEGVPLERCVLDTGIDGLSLLSVGDARAADVDRLTPSSFRRLIAECRDRYDAVIIDTGPVLGSIEAVFATAAADDVVVVLPRGELRSVAEAALHRLQQVGVRIAGVVFNRALAPDVQQSNYSSKSTSLKAEAA
jgi:Mrp family chromosome partitioning ATPase